MLRVEGRLLEKLEVSLDEAMHGASGPEAIARYASAYLAFALEQPRLWLVLAEHQLPAAMAAPDWYVAKLNGPAELLRGPISQLMSAAEDRAVQDAAYSLWSAIHGLALQATSQKERSKEVARWLRTT